MTLLAWLKLICILLVCIMAVFMACYIILMRQAKRLRVVREDFTADGGEGTVFVHISDLHVERLLISWKNICNTIREERPAFVLLTGDLCSTLQQTGRVLSFVDLLASRAGCAIYITFGNNDNGLFADRPDLKKEYIRRLEALSAYVKILDNEAIRDGSLLIGGIEDYQLRGLQRPHRRGKQKAGPHPETEAETEKRIHAMVSGWQQEAAAGNLKFLLASHNPDILLYLNGIHPDLAVCGHTHGGQIWMPFHLEFIALRHDRLPRKGIFYGRHCFNGIPLYITSGLGCSVVPLRFRSCGEIAVLKI